MSIATVRREDLDAARPRAMHIVHVVLSLECGGLEHVVLDLVRSGRDLGQDVSVVCLERKGVLAGRLEAEGVVVTSLDKPPGLQLAAMRRGLRRVLSDIRPDVVHSHQIGALFHVGPVARSLAVPAVIHTEHGKHFDERLKTRWIGRIASRHTHRFCCVSSDIAASVIRHRIAPLRKVAVVANGIDVAQFASQGAHTALDVRRELGIPQDARVIGTVGRLAEIKRQDLLIRAFASVQVNHPEAWLLLVGDGPRKTELKELASTLGVHQRVTFAGYREDRERLLSAMNLFALTSRSEGMPLSVLEAWAAQVPVVASNVGGLPELIVDGETGVLVSDADPANWADVFGTLLFDRARTSALTAEASRQVRGRFSLESMAKRYSDVYRSVPCQSA